MTFQEKKRISITNLYRTIHIVLVLVKGLNTIEVEDFFFPITAVMNSKPVKKKKKLTKNK